MKLAWHGDRIEFIHVRFKLADEGSAPLSSNVPYRRSLLYPFVPFSFRSDFGSSSTRASCARHDTPLLCVRAKPRGQCRPRTACSPARATRAFFAPIERYADLLRGWICAWWRGTRQPRSCINRQSDRDLDAEDPSGFLECSVRVTTPSDNICISCPFEKLPRFIFHLS